MNQEELPPKRKGLQSRIGGRLGLFLSLGFAATVVGALVAIDHGRQRVPAIRPDHARATFEVGAEDRHLASRHHELGPECTRKIHLAETAVAKDDLSFCAETVPVAHKDLCETLVDVGYHGRATRADQATLRGWLRDRGYERLQGTLTARLGANLYLAKGRDGQRFLLETRDLDLRDRTRVTAWGRPVGTRRLTTEAGFGPPLPVFRVTPFGRAVEGVLRGPDGQQRSVSARIALDALVRSRT